MRRWQSRRGGARVISAFAALTPAILFLVTLLLVALPLSAQDYPRLNDGDSALQVEPEAEIGFLKVFYHQIKIGEEGTQFDYVEQGGQEILYPYKRFAVNIDIGERNYVKLLYQPLSLETRTRVDEGPIRFDDVTYGEDTGLNLTYGFDFYRATYLFNAVANHSWTVGLGASLQLRNASIAFESTNGENFLITQNLGPVPIIATRTQYEPQRGALEGAFFELEAEGFYATNAFINGADYEFTGSIFDVGLTAGYEANPATELYVTLRAVGGGGAGTRPPDAREFWTESRDGFTDNFLTLGALSIGARLK